MTNVVGCFDAAAPNDPVSHLGRLHFLATASQNVSIAGYRQCASRLSKSRIALSFPKLRYTLNKGKPHHRGGALGYLWC